jgi:hypothetical protein
MDRWMDEDMDEVAGHWMEMFCTQRRESCHYEGLALNVIHSVIF